MKRNMMRLLCLLVVFGLLTGVWMPMRAEASGSTLKVYVAYWGQNHAQPILKETFSRSELSSLGVERHLYTAYDKGNFCRYAEAEGVLLTDVLHAANINYKKADSLHFYTTDEPGGYDNPYTLNYLFADRYSFPLLSQYYGTRDGFYDEENPDMSEEDIIEYIKTNRDAVPVILALKDNYSRVDPYSVFEGGSLDSSNSFHLLFGQKSPTDQTSSRHAKWIESIVVLYDHYPKLTTDETELNLTKDNNGYKVEVSLSNNDVDPELRADVMDSLKWSVSDSTVVSLDPAGNGVCYLNIHAPGKVTVTVTSDRYYGSGGSKLSLSITIEVADDEEFGNGEGEGTGEGDGTGDGSGSGEGSGDGTGSGEGEGNEGGNGGDAETGDGEGQQGGQGDGSGEQPTESPADIPDESPQPDDGDSNAPSEPEASTDPTEKPTEKPIEKPTEKPTEPPVEEPTRKPPAASEETKPTEEPVEEPTEEELYLTPDQGNADLEAEPPKTDAALKQKLNVRKLVMSGSEGQSQAGESSGHEGGSQAQVLFEKNPLMTFTVLMAVVLFCMGGAGRYVIYRREITGE